MKITIELSDWLNQSDKWNTERAEYNRQICRLEQEVHVLRNPGSVGMLFFPAINPAKITVIKVVRIVLNLGLKEAKELVEGGPAIKVTYDQVVAIRHLYAKIRYESEPHAIEYQYDPL